MLPSASTTSVRSIYTLQLNEVPSNHKCVVWGGVTDVDKTYKLGSLQESSNHYH